MGFLWTLVSHLHTLAGPLVMLLYPLYASLKAIETQSTDDDQQWLTYWSIYSSLTFLEVVAAPVFTWIPFWSSIKLVGACWLVLPPFRGAHYAYDHLLRGLILKQEKVSDNDSSAPRHTFHGFPSSNARESFGQYTGNHAADALDNIIPAAIKETYRSPFA